MTTLTATARPQREVGVAYLLWFFLGAFGAHRFYLGRKGTGVLYLLTLGLLGVGTIVDAFLIPRLVRQANTPVVEDAA